MTCKKNKFLNELKNKQTKTKHEKQKTETKMGIAWQTHFK